MCMCISHIKIHMWLKSIQVFISRWYLLIMTVVLTINSIKSCDVACSLYLSMYVYSIHMTMYLYFSPWSSYLKKRWILSSCSFNQLYKRETEKLPRSKVLKEIPGPNNNFGPSSKRKRKQEIINKILIHLKF